MPKTDHREVAYDAIRAYQQGPRRKPRQTTALSRANVLDETTDSSTIATATPSCQRCYMVDRLKSALNGSGNNVERKKG